MISKKAQAAQGIMILVLVVVFIFAFIMVNMWGSTVMDVFTDEITEENGYTNESVTAVTGMTDAYPDTLDGIGVFILGGLWILVLIMGYNAHSHPLVGFLAIIIVIIIGLAGMIISNTWDEMNDDSEISSITVNYPMMSFVMNNYLLVVLVVGFSMVAAMFIGSSQSG